MKFCACEDDSEGAYSDDPYPTDWIVVEAESESHAIEVANFHYHPWAYPVADDTPLGQEGDRPQCFIKEENNE